MIGRYARISSSIFLCVKYRLNMTPGNWHRLDNIFGILSLDALMLHLASFTNPKTKELLTWLLLCITLWFQERSPWAVSHTLIPILITCVISLSYAFFIRSSRPRYNGNAAIGAVLLGIGFIFFALGLDDEHDWLRLYHGLWHSFAGLSAYFFFYCRSSDPANEIENKAHST